MGPRIPDPIRKRVAQQWVEGVSRDKIAKDNHIGTGTVNRIIREFKEDGFDLDLVREVALVLKRKGLDVNLLPSSVRLRKRLEERGLSEKQIDSLIENIDVHCFKRGITAEQFVDTIQNISELLDNLAIPVDKLPQFIAKKKEEYESLKIEVRDIVKKRRRLLREFDVTMDVLDDYDRNKGKLQNYEAMEKQVFGLQQQLNSYSGSRKIFLSVTKDQLETINTFLIKTITQDDFSKMIHFIWRDPIKNIDIIKELQKRALGKYNDVLDDAASKKNEN